MPRPKLGVGIVGANWAVRGHLPGWRALPRDVEVVAICTAHQETADAAAARYGLPRAYDAFEKMLDDPDISIVSLGTRPPLRYRMTMDALARGKHVFSCIPFAVTLAQAREMAAAQTAQGRVGALDAYFIWTPAFSYAKDLIDREFLGELVAVTVNFSMPLFNRLRSDYPYRWTGEAENGTGIVPNNGSHVFHTLLHLFGDIDCVVGQTAIAIKTWIFEDGTSQTPEVPDTATILGRFRNGAMFNIHAGRSVPSGQGFFLEAYGTGGRLVLRAPHYPYDRTTTLIAAKPARLGEGREEVLEVPARYFEVPGAPPDAVYDSPVAISMGRLFANMIKAIRHGGDAEPSFTRGVQVQAIVDAVQRSVETHAWVSIERKDAA